MKSDNDLFFQAQDQEIQKINFSYKDAIKNINHLLQQSENFVRQILVNTSQFLEPEQVNSTSTRRKLSIESKNKKKVHNEYNLQAQPSILKGQLRSFQLVGLQWLMSLDSAQINGILADEMGLGKTVQTTALFGALHQFQNRSGPFLVIAPKSVISYWVETIYNWIPDFKVIKLIATYEERIEGLQRIQDEKFNVIVTSYSGLQLGYKELKKIHYDYVIIDEAMKLKSNLNQFAVQASNLKTDHKLLLTGTPFQNNLNEMWSILLFLMPEMFSKSQQLFQYFFTQQTNQLSETENVDLVNKMKRIIRPFFLRRTKDQVYKEIPPKQEYHLKVGMSEMQKNMYIQLITNKSLIDQKKQKSYQNILMQLRKCTNHPYMFEHIEDPNLDPQGEHLIENSGKMMLLDKLLKRILFEGKKVLIFSNFTSMLDIIQDFCELRDYGYYRIDGNVDLESRDNQVKEFNSKQQEKKIFLISTRAGGLGINLTSAEIVILFDSDFNPQIDKQAIDRAHRIGQKKEVRVYRFITKDTIEEKIIERQFKKLILDKVFIENGKFEDNLNKNLSKQDILQIIAHGAKNILLNDKASYTDEDIDSLIKKGKENFESLKEELNKLQENIQVNEQLMLNPIKCYETNLDDEEFIQNRKIIFQKIQEQIELEEKTGKRIRKKQEESQSEYTNKKKLNMQFLQLYPIHQYPKNRNKMRELFNNIQSKNIELSQNKSQDLSEFNSLVEDNYSYISFDEYQKIIEFFENNSIYSKHLLYDSLNQSQQDIDKYIKDLIANSKMLPVKEKQLFQNVKQQIEDQEFESNIQGIIKNLQKLFIKSVEINLPQSFYKGKTNKKVSLLFNKIQDNILLEIIVRNGPTSLKNIKQFVKQNPKARFDMILRLIKLEGPKHKLNQN